jgi:hypothetical protein
VILVETYKLIILLLIRLRHPILNRSHNYKSYRTLLESVYNIYLQVSTISITRRDILLEII